MRIFLLCLLALAISAAPLRAETEPDYRGRLLVEVLREFRDRGLHLLFSSDLISEDLRVTVQPTPGSLRSMLEEMLTPLDLKAKDGPGGSILIVPSAAGRLSGRVRSAGYRRPIVDATIRVAGTGAETITGADGSFQIRGIPPGIYELEVEALGFSTATVERVHVTERWGRRLTIELIARADFVTEVVVTPGRHSLVHEVQSRGHSVSSDDAVLVPTIGGDVSRVVELLPGVAAPDNSAAFHARGSVARDVSLVLDGLELYDAYHLQSLQSPFTMIDTSVVDRVDLVGGGFTADLGDRHGGFVEIATATPGPEADGQIELGTLSSRFSYRTAAGNSSSLFSLRGWYPETLTDSIGLDSNGNLDPRFADLYAKTVFELSDRTLLSAHGLLAYERLKSWETTEEINESVDARTKNGYLWLRWLTTRPGLTSETVLSGGVLERKRDGVAVPGDGPVVVADYRDVEFLGVKSDLTWHISARQAFKAGADVRWLHGDYLYSNELPENPASSTSIRLDPRGYSTAAYATHRVGFSTRFAAELGVRWDRQTHTNDNQVSPRFNAVWQPGQRSEVRLAVGRFGQSQRIQELQVADGEIAFSHAEVAEQVELSFQHGFKSGLRIRIDAYFRTLSRLRPRYENLFGPTDLFQEIAADRVMISPSSARLRGIETMLRGNARRPFFWWVSYALSSAEDRIDGEYVPRSWDQTHAGKFLVGYRREDRWNVSLTGSVHNGWPTTPVSGQLTTLSDGTTVVDPVFGRRNADRFGTYARLDVKARRVFSLPRGNLSLTLEATNVTDRDNACCASFSFEPQPDGTVDVSKTLDYWLGITPSFAVLWEF